MFDIGFWELGLIAVVALLVIGPEQLPGVARTVGRWVGATRRFVSNVKDDINAEVSKAEELQRLIDEQAKLKSVHEILESTIPDENERKPVPRDSADTVTEVDLIDSGGKKPKEPAVSNNTASENKP